MCEHRELNKCMALSCPVTEIFTVVHDIFWSTVLFLLYLCTKNLEIHGLQF
jgi:hypothetical protein